MRIDVKICGITSEAVLEGAIEAGADAIGLVLSPSLRRVDGRTAERLLGRVGGRALTVAVVRRPSPEDLVVIRDLPFDVVQVEEDDVLDVRIPILRAFADGPDLQARLDRAGWPPPAEPAAYEGRPVGDPWRSGFLVDGPGGGGQGATCDFGRAAVAALRGPMVLAGGLRPDSVAQAIATVLPRAVDVSSGVESFPGRKDIGQIRAFIMAVHEAEARMSGVDPAMVRR